MRGRAAAGNPTGRYEQLERTDDFTDFDLSPFAGELIPDSVATQVSYEKSKSILTENNSPDVPFKLSVNPYRGCEHGCIYCYARPSHNYLGLSSGLDFETKLFVKENAAELLKKEFQKKSYKPRQIAIGANTDPYQPVEKKYKVTRSILEVCLEHRNPAGIIIKSELVLRDLDLLQKMAEHNLISVNISLTSLDPELSGRLEPRGSRPHRRLTVIRKLREAGIPTGILMAPVIPALNDHEIEELLKQAGDYGAEWADSIFIRLPHDVKELFEDWLDKHYPLKKDRVLNLIRNARGGKLYNSDYNQRMSGTGMYAEVIHKRFALARKKAGIMNRPLYINTDDFVHNPAVGMQQELF